MPTQKPRIALTVPYELNEILERMSDLTNQPKSKIVVDLLMDILPVIDEMCSSLQHAKDMKDTLPALAKLTALANEKTSIMNSEMSFLMSQIGKGEE